MHFDEAVQYLLGLGNEVLTMKLGLHNTEQLFQSLANPERAFPAVQIAGTNGKGSVTAILDSICRQAGIRTGRYTSPHLSSITERITINSRDISHNSFAAHATAVRNAANDLLAAKAIENTPTFFEQITAIAMSAFRDDRVELAILETGLGGRLDSTTAANAQLVAITPIALDHQQYLGTTLAEIAAEKAAIIQRGKHVVVGPQPPEARAVILAQCEANDVLPTLDTWTARVVTVTDDGRFCVTLHTDLDTYENLSLGLRGKHQIDNTAIAIQLAERLGTLGFAIPHDAIVTGVAEARHPGRLELFHEDPPVLLDGAHNPAGANALRNHLEQFAQRPLTIVFGCLQDKQLDEISKILFRLADRLLLTPVNNPRTVPLDQLAAAAREVVPADRITLAPSSYDAMKIARTQTNNGLVCVTGSLYLVGEVRQAMLSAAGQAVASN